MGKCRYCHKDLGEFIDGFCSEEHKMASMDKKYSSAEDVRKQPNALEKQVGGDHYKKNKIQPWHIIDEYELDFYLGNALKYLLREKGNKKEDLGKCIHYLERKLELLEVHPKQGTLDLCQE